VSLHLGLRNPFGVGVSYEVAPVYFFPIEVGAGYADDGVQLAALARLRLPLRSLAFSFGAGVSRGPYTVGSQDCVGLFGPCSGAGSGAEYHFSAAAWSNYELSLEHRSSGGFQWRLYVGYRKLGNSASAECKPTQGYSYPVRRYCAPTGISTPYLGVSFGYAFFL